MQLSEQEIIRREKLQKLRELRINPYPSYAFEVTDTTSSCKDNYQEGKKVSIVGRIMARRIQGNASFAEIQDAHGRIQLYFNRDEICPQEDKTLYNEVYKKLLDIGDIIGVEGELFTTQVGEKTIKVKSYTVLNKSLRPLPLPKTDDKGFVHDAFTDPEQRYRMRYVDLIVNPHVKKTFEIRSKIFSEMRKFFDSHGFMEVETPILQPIPGGAAARPFVTHHNALDIPLYLRIANELYLKRLIVGGYDAVYEFAKNFRNEGMDKTHNPEFTIMELYVAYKDYEWMMNFTEHLLEHLALQIHGTTELEYQGNTLSFKPPYPRIPFFDLIKNYTGKDLYKISEEELRETASELQIEIDGSMGYGKILDKIFAEYCEPHLIQPTFVMDYPIEMSPLTKAHRSKPGLAERFELIVNGKEIANAYSELNDPIDQRQRFEEQLRLMERGDDEAMYIDHDFLRALEFGMPPTAGIGIGMDRLVMLFTQQDSIQEVIFFPQMRPERFHSNLSEHEKLIVSLLKPQQRKELTQLRGETRLSSKKWDKAMKELSQKGFIKVVVNERGEKFVELLKT